MDLRRAGVFREVSLEPLQPNETALLAERLLGRAPSRELAGLLHAHRRTAVPGRGAGHGVAVGRAVTRYGARVALADGGTTMPVPETVRDLVLLRTAALDDAQRAALEVASVAGTSFELDLVAGLVGGEEHLDALLEQGLLLEPAPGVGAFRDALIREACYREITWPRRRALHRQIAERLEERGAAPGALVEHWTAARDMQRARAALIGAMEAASAAYAYRDATAAAQRALELWPEGEAEIERTWRGRPTRLLRPDDW